MHTTFTSLAQWVPSSQVRKAGFQLRVQDKQSEKKVAHARILLLSARAVFTPKSDWVQKRIFVTAS